MPCSRIGLLEERVGRTPILKEPVLTNVDATYGSTIRAVLP